MRWNNENHEIAPYLGIFVLWASGNSFLWFLLLQCVVYVSFIPQIAVCLFTMCYHDSKVYDCTDINNNLLTMGYIMHIHTSASSIEHLAPLSHMQ